MQKYTPPYQVSTKSLKLVASICELLGNIETHNLGSDTLAPQLRRENRIRTIHASLAIENNTLSLEQVTDIIDGKAVFGPPRDIQEVRGAIAAYERLEHWQAYHITHLLEAHKLLMHELVAEVGTLRTGGVGIFKGEKVVHMAPPAHLVRTHLENLLDWLAHTDEHALIASCVFHYEFEFIHPFQDGNGRMGRLWQTLILSKWKSLFAYLPIETLVHNRQNEYYESLGKADQEGNSTAFIEFMLETIFDAMKDLVKKQEVIQESDLVSDLVSDPVTPQVMLLLQALIGEAKGTAELMQELTLKHKPTFRKNYLAPALQQNLIAYTKPQTPNSPTQKYILTSKGRSLIIK